MRREREPLTGKVAAFWKTVADFVDLIDSPSARVAARGAPRTKETSSKPLIKSTDEINRFQVTMCPLSSFVVEV